MAIIPTPPVLRTPFSTASRRKRVPKHLNRMLDVWRKRRCILHNRLGVIGILYESECRRHIARAACERTCRRQDGLTQTMNRIAHRSRQSLCKWCAVQARHRVYPAGHGVPTGVLERSPICGMDPTPDYCLAPKMTLTTFFDQRLHAPRRCGKPYSPCGGVKTRHLWPLKTATRRLTTAVVTPRDGTVRRLITRTAQSKHRPDRKRTTSLQAR